MIDLIGDLLNQRFFSGLVILSCAAALLRPDVKSLGILLFGLGYFSTQIPLSLGYQILGQDKLFLQALVCISMIFGYASLPATRYILFAMSCEAALIFINIITISINLHDWWHWMLFCVINYASFTALCLNKWRDGHDRREPESCTGVINHSLDHIYSRAKGHFRKKA
jgi:hypothetical protein